VIEIVEAVGLWLLKRWGEYFAMVATSIGIPYEIYDLSTKVTVLRVGAFIINVALVVYLVVTKRLFGVRGGKKAYEARLRSESILQAEIDALAAAPAASGPLAAGRAAGAGRRPTAAGGQPASRLDPAPGNDSAPDTDPAIRKDPASGERPAADGDPAPHRETTAPAPDEPTVAAPREPPTR
jgi:hypothetical protein